MSECGCDHCERALSSPPFTAGVYDDACEGCIARSLARSLAMHKAMRHKEPAEIEEAIARNFPRMTTVAAKRLVLMWWKADHPEESAGRRAPVQKQLEST